LFLLAEGLRCLLAVLCTQQRPGFGSGRRFWRVRTGDAIVPGPVMLVGCGTSIEALINGVHRIKRFIGVLNDNEWSIAKNVGPIAQRPL
jgi:NADH:ubiquinone oxidoreductase subunit B-like Fe-S oxidoreductase